MLVPLFQGTFCLFMPLFQGTFCAFVSLFQGTFTQKYTFFVRRTSIFWGEMLWVGSRAPLPLIPVRSVEVVVQRVGIFEYFAFAEESFHLDFGCLDRVRSVDDVLLTAH